jgi:Sec-independent protein translocase protein TatA
MNIISNFNGLELFFILILALLIFGPDKLPAIAAKIGSALRVLRGMTAEVMDRVQQEAGLNQETLDSAKSFQNTLNDVKESTSIKSVMGESRSVRTQKEPPPASEPQPTSGEPPAQEEQLSQRVQELENMVQKLKSELAEKENREGK